MLWHRLLWGVLIAAAQPAWASTYYCGVEYGQNEGGDTWRIDIDGDNMSVSNSYGLSQEMLTQTVRSGGTSASKFVVSTTDGLMQMVLIRTDEVVSLFQPSTGKLSDLCFKAQN